MRRRGYRRYQWLRERFNGTPYLDLGIGGGQVPTWVLADRIEEHWDGDELTAYQHLTHEGQDVCGVDIGWIELMTIRDRMPKGQFLCRDLCEGILPWEPETFSTITASEFFEHIRPYYVSKLLGLCYALLKPGGRLLATTPRYHGGADSDPACFMSADHFCLWDERFWALLLAPPKHEQEWRVSTGRTPFAYFPLHTIQTNAEFCFVEVQKPHVAV